MKKMAKVLLCIMVLSVLAIGSDAGATATYPGWYNCTVQSVGALPAPGAVYVIFATDVTGTFWTDSRVFFLDALEKPGLAAALTALAASGNIALYLPTSYAAATYVQGVSAGVVQ
jgi:hypothetical protein